MSDICKVASFVSFENTEPKELELEPEDTTHSITEVIPGLYISDMYHAQDRNAIEARNIRSIVNVTEDVPTPFEDVEYLRVPIKDRIGVNISDYFEETYNFIESGLKRGGVLVHCGHGISRAPTIVASYLMKRYNIGYDKALDTIRFTRHGIDPNLFFMIALLNLSKQNNI